jgi:hypothetical protein
MRRTYREWYRPSGDELRSLWQDALIILDSNVLLDLYKYPNDAVREFLGVLNALRERIWMPYQIGLEFHKNRERVMSERRSSLDQLIKEINTLRGNIDRLSIPPHHPMLDIDKAEQERIRVHAAVDDMEQMILAVRDAMPLVSPADILHDDWVLRELNSLYQGRTGSAFTAKELSEATIEAQGRYKEQKPPGYRDQDKEEPRRYNDYFIWKQILTHASSAGPTGGGRSCIFVTNERKPDWWRRKGEEVLGPRTELIREYIDEVGADFYMYSPDQFLADANVHLLSNVSTEAIEEVRRISEVSPIEARLRWQRMVLPRPQARVSALSRIYDFVSQGRLGTVNDLNSAIAALGDDFQSAYVSQPLFFSLVNETYGPVRVQLDRSKRLRERGIFEVRSADTVDSFVEAAHTAWLAQALYRLQGEEFDEDQLLAVLFGEDRPEGATALFRNAWRAAERDRASRESGGIST